MNRILPLAVVAFAGLTALAQAQVLFQTGFEGVDRDGRYVTGNINGQPTTAPDGGANPNPKWSVVSGTGEVQDFASALRGSRVMRLAGGSIVDKPLTDLSIPTNAQVVWVEGWFRGTGSSVGLSAATYPSAAQGVPAAALVHFSSANGIEMLDGDGTGTGTVVSSGVALGAANQNNWYRVTLRLNYSTKKYDVYVNGQRRNVGPLGFRDNTVTKLNGFQTLSENESRFDQFRVALPLQGDANGDNIVDSADLVSALNYTAYDAATYDPILASNVALAGTTDGQGRLIVAPQDLVALADKVNGL